MTIKQRMDQALEMAGQTKGAEISQGALKSTPVLFKKFFPGKKAVVIPTTSYGQLLVRMFITL